MLYCVEPPADVLAPPRHIVSCAVSFCAVHCGQEKEESLSLMDCHCSVLCIFFCMFPSSPTEAEIIWARIPRQQKFLFFSPMRIIKPQAAMRTQNDGYTASYPKLTFFFSFSFSLLLTFVGNSPLLHPIYKARGKQCGGCSSASLRFRWVTLLSHCQKRIPHMSS